MNINNQPSETQAVTQKEKLQNILADLRREFKTLYGERLVEMILFGSQARGDAEDGSDIDVLVVLKDDVNPSEEISRTGQILTDLSLKFNEVISCVFMSDERYEAEQSPLLINVRREGRAI